MKGHFSFDKPVASIRNVAKRVKESGKVSYSTKNIDDGTLTHILLLAFDLMYVDFPLFYITYISYEHNHRERSEKDTGTEYIKIDGIRS